MGTLFYQNDKTAEKAIHAATFSNAKGVQQHKPGSPIRASARYGHTGIGTPRYCIAREFGDPVPRVGMLAKTRYALPWALLLDTFGVCKTTGLRTYRSSALPSVCLLIAPDFKNAFASRLDFK